MKRSWQRTAWPALGLASFLVVSSPAGSAEQYLTCRPDFVSCNYGEHFSGTLHWRSVLKTAGDPANGRPAEVIAEDVTVTVADGKTTCSGTMLGKAIKGSGLLAVERGTSMEDAPDQPWYQISASCPGPDGKVPDIMNTDIQTYKQKDTTVFKTLTGSLKDQHPDADPDNGVTGTIQLDWSLTRKGNAPI